MLNKKDKLSVSKLLSSQCGKGNNDWQKSLKEKLGWRRKGKSQSTFCYYDKMPEADCFIKEKGLLQIKHLSKA